MGKLYSRIINDRLLGCLESTHNLHEGRGGFGIGGSCIDDVFALNELIQGHLGENEPTYAFFWMLVMPMMWSGGMGYGLGCGRWALGVRCGGLCVPSILVIGAAFFCKVGPQNFSQMIRVWLEVVSCHLPFF